MACLQNKKAMGSPPYPQLIIIPKISNMCRQAQFKTCHHQNTDVVFILVLKIYPSLLTTPNSLLQRYDRVKTECHKISLLPFINKPSNISN